MSFRYAKAADISAMDIDQPEHDPTRLDYYSVRQQHYEDGPARKRQHSELNTPLRPFQSHPLGPALNYSPNTPFIFHTARNQFIPENPPTVPEHSQFRTYDPKDFPPAVLGFGDLKPLEDVEMRDAADSPARPQSARVDDDATDGDVTAVEGDKEKKVDLKRDESIGKKGSGGKGKQPRPVAMGAVQRVMRKRKEGSRRRREEDMSEGEEGYDGTMRRPHHTGPAKTEHTYNLNMNSPTMRHSEIPALLLGYLQFFVNASVVIFVLYLAVQFVLTVRRDVQDKMAEASVEILQEISECSQLYLTNRCDPSLRVPAMDAPCRAWDVCMHRDPTIVGRTNVMAETFAGVINSFVDPISWKTMGFTLVTLSFLIILTNSALFNLRHRAAPDIPPSSTPHHMYPPIGQAPWMSGGGQQHFPPGYHPSLQSGLGGQLGDQVQAQGQIGWDGAGKGEDTGKKKGWW